MSAEFYTKTIRKEFKYFATWHPNDTIKLGDIGILDGGIFKYKAHLSDFGIDFKTKISQTEGDIHFKSDENTKITYKLSGDITSPNSILTKADAGISIQFGSEESIVVDIVDIKTHTISNQFQLGAIIEDRFNNPKHGETWYKSWVVVTKVLQGASGTVIISKGKNANISLKVNAELGQSDIKLSGIDADFDIVHTQGIGTESIGKKNITPLFQCAGIYKPFWKKSGEFRDRSITDIPVDDQALLPDFFPSSEEDSIEAFDGQPSGQVRVLSVAINSYKSNEVPNLRGCVKDVIGIKEVLEARYNIPENNYKILKNEEATRANIIEAFRSHFSDLQDGDTAIFHYSGHGSWEPTSQEFIDAKIENPGGRNELLVVHDYGEKGILNIADKELRMLISELQYNGTEKVKNIHFVGLMDCCFSGSIFKDGLGAGMIRRTNLPDITARTLNEYLEGQYHEMYSKDNLHIPRADFVLLTACSPTEYALENDNGGLFSYFLKQVLSTERNIAPSYSEIHFLLSNAIRSQSKEDQHPYFEYAGNVNPFDSFLKGGEVQYHALPQISLKKDQWVANIGAIHGLIPEIYNNLELDIFSKDDFTNAIGKARVINVALERTRIKLLNDLSLAKEEQYFIPLTGTKIGFQIIDHKNQQVLRKQLSEKIEAKGLHHRIRLINEECTYRLVFKNDEIQVQKGHELIVGITNINEVGMDYIVDILHKIARWEIIKQVTAPKDSLININEIKFNFSWKNLKGQTFTETVFPYSDEEEGRNEINIPFTNQMKFVPYEINVQNLNTKSIYVFLVHLGRNYSILQKFEDFNKRLDYEDEFLYSSLDHGEALGISNPDVNETKDLFLLFCSRKPLVSPHLFSQESIKEISSLFSAESLAITKDVINVSGALNIAEWTIKKVEVNLKRK